MNSEDNPKAATPIDEDVFKWINELGHLATRANAMKNLSDRREEIPSLGAMLWFSGGVIAGLIHEVVSIFDNFHPLTLTPQLSDKVCNALTLMQCVACNQYTRENFIKADIIQLISPFLHITLNVGPYSTVRLATLGVVGALVQNSKNDVIKYIIDTDVPFHCLTIMENGNQLSKTVASYILFKILLSDIGLAYCCSNYARFSKVAMTLGSMVYSCEAEPSVELLKFIIRSYLRLTHDSKARAALSYLVPNQLMDETFSPYLKDDHWARYYLIHLLTNIGVTPPSWTLVAFK